MSLVFPNSIIANEFSCEKGKLHSKLLLSLIILLSKLPMEVDLYLTEFDESFSHVITQRTLPGQLNNLAFVWKHHLHRFLSMTLTS